MQEDVRALLATALDDPEATWSLGGFGALAEFRRGGDEAVEALHDGRIGSVTARGGIAFDGPPFVPVAYETAIPGGWSQTVALCLPSRDCARVRPPVVTEIGADAAALRPGDAEAVLFALGLRVPQAEIHLRSAEPDRIALLRNACGQPCFAPASPVPDLLAAGALDCVVATPLGRVEVFARSGPSKPGAPRAFVVPRILALRRTHAATAPIPEGLVPCAHLHPPHPRRDGQGRATPFHRARYAAFQALLARWGDPEHVRLKARIMAGEAADGTDRHSRGAVRAARTQAAAMAEHPE